MTARWYNSLRVQIVLLMTVALFPLGAVAIYQTNEVAKEAERNAERALLALTGRAAKSEELIIARAFGAAQLFGTVAADFVDDSARCRDALGSFVDNNPAFSFVGILPVSGVMTCSSTGQTYDFSGYANFRETMAARQRTIVANSDAPASGTSVFVVSEPFEIDGRFAGFVSVSIPHAGLPETSAQLTNQGLAELITFNTDGAILTARSDLDSAVQELPVGQGLETLQAGNAVAFRSRNRRGEPRTYTVVPIQGSPATIMGIWRGDRQGIGNALAAFVKPAVFPVLMWLASMSVAMLSIYSLVLRHVARTRRNMDAFARTRTTEGIDTAPAMPNEIQALHDNFLHMTQAVLQDEAKLEDALREKNVLIKEVHHRVKNNLQLISSIMNMQIRAAKEEETRSVLSRLQDRVLSLATIHRDLYQSQHGGMVNVGELISEVLQNSLEMALARDKAVDVQKDIDPVLLYPDQAVPLSLLMAEATTNVMKYFGARAGRRPWVNIALKQEDAACVLTLSNSIGAAKQAESTGLGGQLINAFAIQLGGNIETEETAESYTLRVSFTAEEFVPDTRDF